MDGSYFGAPSSILRGTESWKRPNTLEIELAGCGGGSFGWSFLRLTRMVLDAGDFRRRVAAGAAASLAPGLHEERVPLAPAFHD